MGRSSESNRDVPSVSVIEVLSVSTFSAVPLGMNDWIMDQMHTIRVENDACENMKDCLVKSSHLTCVDGYLPTENAIYS